MSEIQRNLLTIAEVCKKHQVTRTAVYKWIYKYSLIRKKRTKTNSRIRKRNQKGNFFKIRGEKAPSGNRRKAIKNGLS